MKLALAAAIVVLGCSDGDRPEPVHERVPPRHLPEPVGTMHSLPPHPIRADGIGPYLLGERFEVLYGVAPKLARLEPFDIHGVVHSHIIHAEENETVLIGGEPGGTANFVAVIDPNVARTESGFHIGSTRDELTKALGAPISQIDRAFDPRLVAPSNMRNARAIVDGEHVVAFALTSEPIPERAPADDCPRPAAEAGRIGVCFGAPFVADVDGDDIAIRAPASAPTDKAIASVHVPSLQFAVALRNPAENRDELVAIARIDDAGLKSWILVAFQLEKTKLRQVIEPSPLYQLSSANARWIGAELRDVDLYLELVSRTEAIEVGGLLTTRTGDKIKNVVAISPQSVAHRHGKPAASEAGDAGVPDKAPDKVIEPHNEPVDGPPPTGRSKP
ncbi:MAG TPA: hypothetical protein VGO00_08270 [Kofleriaceae bacterium]|nr:hypothetical protein [Kofleriaceae bacterium]